MTTQVQKRRGTTTEHSTFTGAEGEITVDTTKDTAVVHDGVSAGGKPLAREDLNNVSASTVAAKLNGTAITGVDINSGSIDSTTIGATTPAAGTFTALTATGTTTLAGATTSANINFGDNDKAIFGAGSDLQIYHDGSNSYVKDAGTGVLTIESDGTEIQLNNGSSEYMARFRNNADVRLYYDNSQKLATTSTGIDVTGTATMDGLTVDGVANVISGAASGSGLTVSRSGHPTLSVISGGTDSIFFSVADTGTSTYENAMRIYQNGDISFYEDTGTTAKFFWDASAESLGIGTSSPSAKLDVNSKAAGSYGPTVMVDSQAGTAKFRLTDDSNNSATTRMYLSHNYDRSVSGFAADTTSIGVSNLVFDDGTVRIGTAPAGSNNPTERMRIDSSGRVGIGTDSPSLPLDVHGGTIGVTDTSSFAGLQITSANNSFAYVNFGDSNDANIGQIQYDHSTNSMITKTNNQERIRIDSSGNVGIGTSSPSSLLHLKGASEPTITLEDTSVPNKVELRGLNYGFGIEVNDTERMRIDSAGTLLVGKTTSNYGVAGVEIKGSSTSLFTRDGGNPLALNRLTSDGSIVDFSKDGATVGSIGNYGARPYFSSTSCGFRIGGSDIIPSTATGADSDGVLVLGGSSKRFKDLYLSGGVYLGGTGSANHLDDYETGTFTPTLSSNGTAPTVSSYMTRAGYYTKVGNVVTCQIHVRCTITSAGTGYPIINGLPFTSVGGLAGVSTGLLTQLSSFDPKLNYVAGSNVYMEGSSYATNTNAYLCFTVSYDVA